MPYFPPMPGTHSVGQAYARQTQQPPQVINYNVNGPQAPAGYPGYAPQNYGQPQPYGQMPAAYSQFAQPSRPFTPQYPMPATSPMGQPNPLQAAGPGGMTPEKFQQLMQSMPALTTGQLNIISFLRGAILGLPLGIVAGGVYTWRNWKTPISHLKRWGIGMLLIPPAVMAAGGTLSMLLRMIQRKKDKSTGADVNPQQLMAMLQQLQQRQAPGAFPGR